MSKMGQMVMEMEEMLFDGATYGEIADRFGISVAQVAEYVEQMEADYAEPDIDSYTEYQDLYGGDDQFETCNFCEDY